MSRQSPGNLKYVAFISYSRAGDGALAPLLQSMLRRFARPWYHWRGRVVFRDDTSLRMTPELWPEIADAIDDSAFFVLMASPEAAASKWVHRELEHWLELKRGAPLIVWTGGFLEWNDGSQDFDWARTTAAPLVLKGFFTQPPLYLDLTWVRIERKPAARDPRIRLGVARLLAAIEGRDLESIVGEDLDNRRHLFRLASVLVLLISTLTFFALWEWRAAINRGEINRQLNYVARLTLAERDFNSGDIVRGLQLLDEFLPAAGANGAGQSRNFYWYYLWRKHHLERQAFLSDAPIRAIAYSPNGDRLAVGNDNGSVELWDIGSKRRLAKFAAHKRGVAAIGFSPNGRILASSGWDGRIQIYDLLTLRNLVTLGGGTAPRPCRFCFPGTVPS